ncbi:MAG: GNAT family N-acetyltransferase [Rhodospirillales bacterium]|jgi:GNAT superfamily N-acetyltransferase|nr:GNAT family N-acetyltransferase [Alphaproteobacteria bacterium]MDP6843859.1 GNAT family N-acetyltransferase [Rhodospirillales bacterium]|tara:strand:- start:127 stop:693 length:567 start_codon:yes stop_codon:yes gene_type:complete
MLSWRITYMERTARPENGAPPTPAAGVTFARHADIALDAYRDLHRKVGEEWLWWERLVLDDAALRAVICHPNTEIFVLCVGAEFAGFAELDRSKAEAPAIRFFGLMPDFIGRRLGAYMMESLLRLAWQPPVRRITLDTCDLDHPAAIPFYRRHGFTETHSELCTAEDPRETGILPRTAAPHIPLNRKL